MLAWWTCSQGTMRCLALGTGLTNRTSTSPNTPAACPAIRRERRVVSRVREGPQEMTALAEPSSGPRSPRRRSQGIAPRPSRLTTVTAGGLHELEPTVRDAVVSEIDRVLAPDLLRTAALT